MAAGCNVSPSRPAAKPESGPPAQTPPQMAKVGFIAPDFKLKNTLGEFVTLNQLRGKIVVINFWATWCEPCRSEMPSMEEVYRNLSRKDFEILAVSTDDDGLASVLPFLKEFAFTFPVLIDSDLTVNDLYGVSSIPTSLIVDRNGMITNRFFGAIDWADPKQKDLLVRLIQSPV
jgi:peroxiredoxin